jgi:dipeptidase E
MGGGGFTMHERSPALDRLALELSGKPVPKICFLPTASGDPTEQVTRFYERFSGWPCEPTSLALFHLGRDRINPFEHLLAQDVIYVGGGSLRNLLAIWREHHIDETLRAAWEQGAVLAGLSAGAICWFEGGVSTSGGVPKVVAGLSLLSGSLSVHLDSEPERRPVYNAAVASGQLPPGYAADDGAALVFGGTRLVECVGTHGGARVLRVRPDGAGGVVEQPLPIRLLEGADGADGDPEDSYAISELRELRAGRHRWD